jgi:hypothetical protein
MKFSVAAAILALAASVSAQSVGPVDPAKLPVGWCMMFTDSCKETTALAQCGANSTITTDCVSTFSMDKICTSFTVSCLCTPQAGGEKKDISAAAFNETIERKFFFLWKKKIGNKNGKGRIKQLLENEKEKGATSENQLNKHKHSFLFLCL